MRKYFFFLIIFYSLGAAAQNAELFEQANLDYSEGKYEEAIEKYTKILENGETSAAVHFNLGNAHYKLNQIAPSIYHYEKALQLKPNDKDIRNNIGFARNMTIDAIEEKEKTGIFRWWNDLVSAQEPQHWGWAGILFMFLFSLMIILYYFNTSPWRKRIFFITASLSLVLALISIFLGFEGEDLKSRSRYAIVFSEEVEIKSEPNPRSGEVFVLHEGTKIKVLENFQGWARIELANGNQGWTPLEHIREL